jgi:hypothetical protein
LTITIWTVLWLVGSTGSEAMSWHFLDSALATTLIVAAAGKIADLKISRPHLNRPLELLGDTFGLRANILPLNRNYGEVARILDGAAC